MKPVGPFCELSRAGAVRPPRTVHHRICRQHISSHPAERAKVRRIYGMFERAFAAVDWVPLTIAVSAFAIVADFEDAIYCCPSQAA